MSLKMPYGKYFVSVFIFGVVLLGCTNKESHKEIPLPLVSNDTLDKKPYITILKCDQGLKNIVLSETDLSLINTLLEKAVREFNLKDKLRKQKLGDAGFKDEKVRIDLRYYKRQYVAYENAAGEREVWINCFCRSVNNDSWRKKVLIVSDGGDCYFSLKINLTTKKYFDFITNGLA